MKLLLCNNFNWSDGLYEPMTTKQILVITPFHQSNALYRKKYLSNYKINLRILN
jgi:hypothetical protein